MDLLSPFALALLLLLPVLVGARIWLSRRRRSGVRYSSLSLVHVARPRSSRIRRHLPFALFVLALGSLILAVARPAAIVSVPAGETTVILALDVSRSMCATDIAPSRIEAAEAAASRFIERQGSTTQIGIVAFAGFAEIVQAPTTDHEVLLDVVASLTTGRRTAVGSGILESIDAISEVDPSIPRSDSPDASPGAGPAPVPNGAYAPAVIVLLTDGSSNAGPLPTDAAAQAAARGLRVYTIGFGTDDPGAEGAICGEPLIGNEPGGGFGGGGFGGGFGGGGGAGFSRGIDETTLKAVAETTGGNYYPASSADQLDSVFANLPTNLITKHEVVELSVVFVAIGAVLVAVAILLGQAWRPLP
ncbi:MAG TPA: VWA domain-containing protein [Candidatus Limnocylindrales bacterium]|nr:VWA domain-containing protein [Candidatus Limnocylindrales bacterium]